MISDEDVVQLFGRIPRTPIGFTDAEIAGKPRQIFRGTPGDRWKDAHPGGCLRHMEVFKRFKVIPRYCFDCYKVLVTPRSIVELFKLLVLFERMVLPLDNTRKCMVEARHDCSGAYKGFVYCRGMDEGNEVRKIVRKLVSEEISPQVQVTLKRGCSEYAHVYPGYARIKPGVALMQYRKDWQAKEDFFDANFVFHPDAPGAHGDSAEVNVEELAAYTPWEIFCMQYWLRYAVTIGDTSYLEITRMTLPPLPGLKRPPFRNVIPLRKDPGARSKRNKRT